MQETKIDRAINITIPAIAASRIHGRRSSCVNDLSKTNRIWVRRIDITRERVKSHTKAREIHRYTLIPSRARVSGSPARADPRKIARANHVVDTKGGTEHKTAAILASVEKFSFLVRGAPHIMQNGTVMLTKLQMICEQDISPPLCGASEHFSKSDVLPSDVKYVCGELCHVCAGAIWGAAKRQLGVLGHTYIFESDEFRPNNSDQTSHFSSY